MVERVSLREAPEGEVVGFSRALKISRGSVEEWLRLVEDAMRTSLKSALRHGYIALEASLLGAVRQASASLQTVLRDTRLNAEARTEALVEVGESMLASLGEERAVWMASSFAQVASLAAEIMWTAGTEEALIVQAGGTYRATAPPASVMFSTASSGPATRTNSGGGFKVTPASAGASAPSVSFASASTPPRLRTESSGSAAGSPSASDAPHWRAVLNATGAEGFAAGSFSSPLLAWLVRVKAELAALTALVQTPMPPLQRKCVVAILIAGVHARDVVQRLLDDRVAGREAFQWQSQLRMYLEPESGQVLARHALCTLPYGFEYEGCSARLVITPLTERCWLTLSTAMRLRLGAAPAGPAGTGKTESSKDLAKALGVQCVVFNCSEQLNYATLSRIFAGLAQTGAWACLDEVNRLHVEVLSVVSVMLSVIRRGRLAGAERIQFEGRSIPLRDHHVVITYNPDYSGRTELPDNLKALFRPCAMVLPDSSAIAEVMLASEGFLTSHSLASRVTRLYDLARQQLSVQAH
ncbi:hypothetical protein EON62_02995, partial [archaeon]